MTACRPFDDWPKLLLGPMVRRVTRDSVAIFIATSIQCQARLAVAPGRLPYGEIRDSDFSRTTPAAVTLDRIGQRLWVGLILAALPETTTPGQLYSYDIQLIVSGRDLRLNDLGQLGEPVGPVPDFVLLDTPLGYEVGMLPSFVVPPADYRSLRLAHASCRKPHGGYELEPDALTILDEVISLSLGASTPMPSANEPPPPSNRERPHQLILTGDQIYADDVAAGLLTALTEAGEQLLGWPEWLPGVEPNLNEFMIWPGWRTRFLGMQDIVNVPWAGHPDETGNHLLTFGEWCAMYLFAWSDALWARSEDGQG